MFTLTSIVLLASLAIGSQANGVYQTPQSTPLGVLNPVCELRDYSGLLSLHNHHHHDHGNVCLGGAALNDYNIPTSKAWTNEPVCKNYPKGKKFCIYANASFAGGRGISIITSPQTAKYFAKLPAFSAYQDISVREPPYEVRSLPGRGFGVVANRTIERGELVMTYTVLVAVHNAAFQSQRKDHKFFNSSLEMLPNSSQALYRDLSAHAEGVNLDWQRLNTNAFEENIDDEEHWIVLPETARMNHDCRPNAIYHFDIKTLSHTTVATRRIHAGEEITITYIDPIQTHKQRSHATKQSWGFTCTCPLCQAPRPYISESNIRIQQIIKLTTLLEEFTTPNQKPNSTPTINNSTASPNATSTSKTKSKTSYKVGPEIGEFLISLYEMERIYAAIADAYLLTSKAYNAVGNEGKAREFGARAVEAAMVYYGPGSREVRGARRLMLQPRSHSTWRIRA